jgi:translation initiation factor 1A
MKKKPQLTAQEEFEQDIQRVKIPKGREVFGILERRLGGSRTQVRCLDGKNRVCRIPGRLKRRLWVREGDLLLIEPWEHGGDQKGDVIFKYKPNQVQWLKNKGYLSKLDDFEEF